MSSETKQRKASTGIPTKGKKAAKRTVTPVETDVLPAADVPEVQVGERETVPTQAPADTEPQRTKGRRCARHATSAAKDQLAGPKRLSCLDAAAQVLKAKGEPMRCKDLIDQMTSAGLWSSAAPTPAATLYSAILREIATKGENARFKKTDRGQFGLNA